MKKIMLCIILALVTNLFFAQESNASDSFYINVFINQNKDIRVESNLVTINNIGNAVKAIIYSHPFEVDETITYRVYASSDLDLGYIMDTEQKMLESYSYNVKRERYLLETVQMNIDGPNWLEKLNGLDLKPKKG